MQDIELAKDLLKREDLSLILVRNGQVLYKSKEDGIKPIYRVYKTYKNQAKAASLADKVIGRGAAILVKDLDLNKLYCQLISESALEILGHLKPSYAKKVAQILNKDQTDLCPIERLSQQIKNSKDFIKKLEDFLGG